MKIQKYFDKLNNYEYEFIGELGKEITKYSIETLLKNIQNNAIKYNKKVVVGSDNNYISKIVLSYIFKNNSINSIYYNESEVSIEEMYFNFLYQDMISIFISNFDLKTKITIFDKNANNYLLTMIKYFDNESNLILSYNKNLYINKLLSLMDKNIDFTKFSTTIYSNNLNNCLSTIFKKLKINYSINPLNEINNKPNGGINDIVEIKKNKSDISFIIENNVIKVFDEKGILINYGDLLCLLFDYMKPKTLDKDLIIKDIYTNQNINQICENVIECTPKQMNEYINKYNFLICLNKDKIMFSDYNFFDGNLLILRIIFAVQLFKKSINNKIITYQNNYHNLNSKIVIANSVRLKTAMTNRLPKFVFKPERAIIGDNINKYYFVDNSFATLSIDNLVVNLHVEFPTEIECERVIKSLTDFVNKFKD